MLGAGKTLGGQHLCPRWWAFCFGGTYQQKNGGYGWRPSLIGKSRKYFKENWREGGYSYMDFVFFDGRKKVKRINKIMNKINSQNSAYSEIHAISPLQVGSSAD